MRMKDGKAVNATAQRHAPYKRICIHIYIIYIRIFLLGYHRLNVDR